MLNLRLLPLLWIWPPQSITNRSRGEGDDLDRNYSRCDFLLQGTVLVLQMTERPYKVEVSDPSHKIHTRTFGKLWNAYGCAMEAVVEGPPGTRASCWTSLATGSHFAMRLVSISKALSTTGRRKMPADPVRLPASEGYIKEFDTLEFALEHLGGVPWYKAPLPVPEHVCWAQTNGWYEYVRNIQRCPCGAIRANIGMGFWESKNSRKEKKEEAQCQVCTPTTLPVATAPLSLWSRFGALVKKIMSGVTTP